MAADSVDTRAGISHLKAHDLGLPNQHDYTVSEWAERGSEISI